MKLFVKTEHGSHIEDVDFKTMDSDRLEAFARVGSVDAQHELNRRICEESKPSGDDADSSENPKLL